MYNSPLSNLHRRGWRTEPSAETFELTPGLNGPRHVKAIGPLKKLPESVLPDAKAITEELGDTTLEIEAEFDDDHGHYLLKRFTLESPEGAEVTGALLRQIAPLRVMRWVLPRTWLLSPPPPGTRDDPFVNAAQSPPYLGMFLAPEAKPRPERFRPATLYDAALIYRFAEVVREPPAKAVAEVLNLQPRTATNWIVRAKEQGLL